LGSGASGADATEYLGAAQSILAGHGFPRNASLLFGFHPPLYPLFIALIWKVFGVHLNVVYAAQALLFAFTAALLVRITVMVTDRTSLGLLAGMLFALDPLVLKEVGTVEAEPLEMLLLVMAIFFLLRAVMGSGAHSHPLRDMMLGGAVLGLACLCRDVAEAIVVALAVALWWLLRHAGAVTRWAMPAAMVGVACLVIAPWTILNWRATGDFIPVSTLGGFNLWLGNNPATLRVYEGRFATTAAFQSYGQYLQFGLPAEQARAWGSRFYGATAGGRERLWISAAVREMVDNPGTTAKLWAFKTWGFWRPWLEPVAYPHLQVILSGVVEVTLYVFALGGLVALLRQRRARPFLGLVLAVAAGSTLVSTVSNSNLRYRIPTLDPYLYVLGAVGLAIAVRWLRRGRIRHDLTVPRAPPNRMTIPGSSAHFQGVAKDTEP
jgi:hypothetical protein